MPFLNANTSASVWRTGGVNQVVVQDGNRALYRTLVTYGAGKALIGAVTYVGTGDGTIDDLDGGVDGPAETWTITFTDATNFTVSGSVSGAQAAGVVGTNYTTTGNAITSLLSFVITAGATPFVVADAWTIPVTLGTLSGQSEQWVLDRWSPFTTAGAGINAIDDAASIGTSGALIWHGLGNGSEAFYQGIRITETPASQIWNFILRGYTGFSPTADWDTMPGVGPQVFTAQWNNDMEYWFVFNSRRYVGVWVVSTTMHMLYQGAILPFASPGEWPFPNAYFGEKDDEEAWNSTATQYAHGVHFPDEANGYIRDVAGIWLTADNTTLDINFQEGIRGTINAANAIWDNHENFDSGDHQLMPMTYVTSRGTGTPLLSEAHGVADGCFQVTGFNNSPQTILSVGGTDHLVVNDIFQVEREDFWALRLA